MGACMSTADDPVCGEACKVVKVAKDADQNRGNIAQSPPDKEVARSVPDKEVAQSPADKEVTQSLECVFVEDKLVCAEIPSDKVMDCASHENKIACAHSSSKEEVAQSSPDVEIEQSLPDVEVAQSPPVEDDNISEDSEMRKIQLYGFPLSQPSRSVLLLLSEAEIPYELNVINPLSGECKEPSYLKINPAGLVPFIIDRGLTLGESGAILTYLAESRFLDSWYPSNPAVRAKIQFWMQWHHSGTRTSSMRVLFPAFMKKDDPEGVSVFTKNVEFLEARLGETGEDKFIAGTVQPTIADLMLLPELDQLEGFKLFDYTPYPNVSKYLERCKGALKSYAENYKVVTDFAQAPPS